MNIPRCSGTTVTLSLLVLLLAGGMGFGLGALIFCDTMPATLQSAHPVESVPVSTRDFVDARPVELSMTLGADGALVAPASGRITTFTCLPGGTFDSGISPLAIDGRRMIGLATATPLWRDLSWGDDGDDVRALRTELAWLGYDVAAEGSIDRSVMQAVTQLFVKAGEAGYDDEVISLERFIWLPAPRTQIKECLAATGITGEPWGKTRELAWCAFCGTADADPRRCATGGTDPRHRRGAHRSRCRRTPQLCRSACDVSEDAIVLCRG